MRLADKLPLARPATEFLVEELDGEVLVYDQTNHRAHCLTREAAALLRRCDGSTTTEQAARSLPGTDINALLAQLQAAGLLREAPSRRAVNRSRRMMLRKTATAAAVVLASPVVFSIVAPSVAEAASSCGKPTQPCCAGNTCNGIMNSKACFGSPPTCH